MGVKKEFEMSEEQEEALLEACKPVPYMKITGWASAQDNANRFWKMLGDNLGFEWNTVEPIQGKSTRFFMAVPK